MHRGESFGLFERNGKLYLRFQRYGRLYMKSMRTTQKNAAVERAKRYLLELERNNWMPPTKNQHLEQDARIAPDVSAGQNLSKLNFSRTLEQPLGYENDLVDQGEPDGSGYDYLYESAVINVLKFEPRAFDARTRKRDRPSVRNDTFPKSIRRTLLEVALKGLDSHDIEYQKTFEETGSRWNPRFKPDLWFIDSECREVSLFEIEDTSPLKNKKLENLVNFWWFMDKEGWNVKCWVFDRYGLNPRLIHLKEIAMARLEAIPIPQGVGHSVGDEIFVPFKAPEEAGGGVRFIKIKKARSLDR